MCDLVRTKGYVQGYLSPFNGPAPENRKISPVRFWEVVKKSSVIVLPEMEVLKPVWNPKVSGVGHPIPSLPFPTTCFEVLNQCLYYNPPNIGSFSVGCWLLDEITPDNFEVFLLVKSGDEEFVTRTHSGATFFKDYVLTIINSFSEIVSRCRSGSVNIKESIRIGSKTPKELHKIRRIVIVHPNPQKTIQKYNGIPIDWSHRWSVRGHWRKVRGLGKDRNDDYSVSGYTWVHDHIRGPEKKPLIKKTRVVDGFQSTGAGPRN